VCEWVRVIQSSASSFQFSTGRRKAMAVERVRMMEDLILLEQSDGQIDVFPEKQLVIVAADGIETGFAKQGS
jgi:hypothetical protein